MWGLLKPQDATALPSSTKKKSTDASGPLSHVQITHHVH
jgi:hypothetical protein